MSDREQATKDVAEALKINAGLILMAFDGSEVPSDRSRGCDLLVYAVSQRERVIQLERDNQAKAERVIALERVLREIRDEETRNACGCEDHTSPDCCVQAKYHCAECIAGAALNGTRESETQ